MNLPAHDFKRPARIPSELRLRLVPWLHRANAIFAETMGTLGLKLQAQLLDQSTAWPLDTLDEWTGKPIAFRVLFMGCPSLLAIPNRLAQSLVAGLLGDSVPADAPERELTAVEMNLCELVVKTLIESLLEAWVDELSLVLDLREREPNLRRSKVFRPSEPLVVCRSSMKIQETEQLWSWMVRVESLVEVFGSELPGAAATPVVPQRHQMESVVRGMTVPMTVKLGHVQLTTPQLAELQVGDVIVLHQKTTQPLKAFVSGKPAFLGWPGQIGGKQAFQIEADLAK